MKRVLCRRRASSLVFRMRHGLAYAVAIQVFEEVGNIDFTSENLIDEKPFFYAFANESRKLTGAEFIAAATGEGA